MSNITVFMKGPGVGPEPGSVSLLTIPSINLTLGQTHDMSQYIVDPTGIRTTSRVVGLAGFATYSAQTELLTGAFDGVEADLTFEVDW